MSRFKIVGLFKIAAFSLMAGSAMYAQTPAVKHAAESKGKAVPRTADGHPSLEGSWTNATLTTLERPKEAGDKQYFTPAEAAAYEKQLMVDLL